MSSAPFAATLLAFAYVFAPVAWAAAPLPASSSISDAEARQALDVLTDPARRAQVVTTLEAIVHA
ncbi:MAG: hypothetical protein WBQ75_03380, partial [Acetobacteraceae bacterium]